MNDGRRGAIGADAQPRPGTAGSLDAKLLAAISLAQSDYIDDVDTHTLFDQLLKSLLEITGSEYGFIGEMLNTEDGVPHLKTHALINIAWNLETRKFCDENAPSGLEFRNLETLFGAVIRTGRLVIANSPGDDPRRGGLPKGHPALNAFLGLPFYKGSVQIGMVGIANRAGGYDQELADTLEPFLATCANIIEAHRNEQRRRESERAMRDREARYRALFESAVDGIITIDEQGEIQEFNPAAERLFGYRAEEIVGHKISRLMPSPHREAQNGYLARYLETGIGQIVGRGREAVGVRQDGSEFPIEIAVSEVLLDAQRLFTGTVRDLTERRRIDRMKDEFVAVVGHELRTPLTSIRGALGLLSGGAAGELPSAAKGMVDVAFRNSRRLETVVNDILDVEKIEAGRLSVALSPVALHQLAQRAIDDSRGSAQPAEVALALAETSFESTVMADGDRVLQVLTNLLSNAIKFSPKGSEVRVALTAEGEGVRAEVIDRGPGVPEDFRPHLFEKFAQADGSDSRRGAGTGLGLSISRALVERMGGRIGFAANADGPGTTFYFALPRPATVTAARGEAG